MVVGATHVELALRTSPSTADSDGDGALDGVEFENGTDPLAQDSDGNSVTDGDEDQDRNGMPERKQRAARLHGSDEAPRAANHGGAENRGTKAGQGKNIAGCPGRAEDSALDGADMGRRRYGTAQIWDGADMDDEDRAAPTASGTREMTAPPAPSGEARRDVAAESTSSINPEASPDLDCTGSSAMAGTRHSES